MFNPFGGMSCLSIPSHVTCYAPASRPARCSAALGARARANHVLPELLVVSPSLVPIEASKTGSSVTAMTGEEARASGFSQLSDVMRTFPGMHVNQSGARGSLTQFRVRGAEANHLLVMIDGVPANAVGDGEFNFADIPIDDIERVELLRGPQSGLYGANAHSGVLTIVTKSGRGLASPSSTRASRAARSAPPKAAASARGSAGPFYGSITAIYATTNGFNIARDGNESDGAKRTAVTGKAGVDFSPNFNVEGFVRHTAARPPYDPQDPFFLNTGLVDDAPGYFTNFAETLARVEGTLKLFDERWIQSVKWTASRQDLSATRELRAKLRVARDRRNPLLQECAAARFDVRWAARRIASPGSSRTGARSSAFGSIFLFGPDLDAARNGYKRTSTGVGGEYVLDLLRPARRLGGRAAGLQRPVRGRVDLALLAVAEDRPDRRTSARQRRARRDQSELHRAVRLPHLDASCRIANLVPESSIGWDAGWEQTFWNGRVVFDVTYFNSRLENEIVLGRRCRASSRRAQPRPAPRPARASRRPSSSGRSTG